MFRSAKIHFIIGIMGLAAGAACLAQSTAGQGVAANGPVEIDGLNAPAAGESASAQPKNGADESSSANPSDHSHPETTTDAAPAATIDHNGLNAIPTIGPFRPETRGRNGTTPNASTAAAATSIPTESKSLGKPNSALSARPSVSGEAQANGLMSQIDPRTNDITRVIGALAAIIGLLLLLKTIMRKVSGGLTAAPRPSGVIEILARYPMARGQQLMVLKLARRILLLHQSGSALTTLSEIVDSNEVASLLARLEAGSSQRDAAKFRHVLEEFAAEHEKPSSRSAKLRMNLPMGDAEIVDLTRRSNRGLRGLLSLGGLW